MKKRWPQPVSALLSASAAFAEAFEDTRYVKLVETTGGITISSAILEAARRVAARALTGRIGRFR